MSPEGCFVTLIHCIQRTSGFIDYFSSVSGFQ